MSQTPVLAPDDLLRRLSGAIKVVHLYAADHPNVGRAIELLGEVLDGVLERQLETVLGIVEGQLVVDGQPVAAGPGAGDALSRLAAAGVDRLAIGRGVTRDELLSFVRRLPASAIRKAAASDQPIIEGTEHIRISRLRLQARGAAAAHDMQAARQGYAEAVAGAEALWDRAAGEGSVDPALAHEIIEGLAQLVSQNQRALVALTALCEYDNYTFTHMVNVGILTMAQARCVGIEGEPLRQFGVAGLMHDIGKIRTPKEILTKPSQLTDDEFVIMRQHPVTGAEMLRRQVEMPPLAAVVAFEHHLRIDGTGYPGGVRRQSLNLATQFCAIADVYDAMRSQRVYQEAHPTERILAVLQQNDGKRFDQDLVRRFAQLIGVYPPGNFVQLDTGAIAVVLRVHAPDPARPLVRVIIGPDGIRLQTPVDLALWDDGSPAGPPPRIVTPVKPADVGIDPLPYLDSAPV